MGVPGRILNSLKGKLSLSHREEGRGGNAMYTIGALPFMRKASEIFTATNYGSSKDVFLSIETATRCGVGLCGECECGGHLTCREGTFFSLDYLNSKKINLDELIHED